MLASPKLWATPSSVVHVSGCYTHYSMNGLCVYWFIVLHYHFGDLPGKSIFATSEYRSEAQVHLVILENDDALLIYTWIRRWRFGAVFLNGAKVLDDKGGVTLVKAQARIRTSDPGMKLNRLHGQRIRIIRNWALYLPYVFRSLLQGYSPGNREERYEKLPVHDAQEPVADHAPTGYISI
ncbi:hypothetical protein K438DRAFT_1776481 [Mycena galopus ATCC 62051]|nr:hypothetical protein K438DRAFT_1776481 [Mycena galopus ATCC 62051]